MTRITARTKGIAINLRINRPSWTAVHKGYPKTLGGPAVEDDLPADSVFSEIFGPSYDRNEYANACGTRVSLALLSGKINRVGVRDIKITVETHEHYGKFIEPGAARLKEFLEKPRIWGPADENIESGVTLDKVKIKLNGKTGVYIMIPKSPKLFGASGHASLWTGNRVIGDHHYISANTHGIYFWELK
jgi:hypothetical protein